MIAKQRHLVRLELFIRNRMPDWFRFPFRIMKLMSANRRPFEGIPAEHFIDARLCASRVELLSKLEQGGKVVEIGTYKGDFARHIIERCAPDELHLIDLDFGLLGQDVAKAGSVKCHEGTSLEKLAEFPDAYFDWVYLDADHAYPSVISDARAAAPKIKPGGLLLFNDFAHLDRYLGSYGVHQGVATFLQENPWQIEWLAYEPNGLFDIALRKPS